MKHPYPPQQRQIDVTNMAVSPALFRLVEIPNPEPLSCVAMAAEPE